MMFESLLGVSVAATRQNAGKSANVAVLMPCSCASGGATNLPFGTSVAIVMVAFGSFKPARLSQEPALAGDAVSAVTSMGITATTVHVCVWIRPTTVSSA